jgi:hypothetical protein
MTVHVFHCSTQRSRYGLTQDRTGANLPQNACPNGTWVYERTLEINAGDPPLISGLRAEVIIEHIERDGYYIVDITIQTTERIVG